jgi:hypothetical protein
MKTLIILLLLLRPAFVGAAQPDLNVPEGVPTKVTLSPGRVETLPLTVGIRKGKATIKLGRTQLTDPSTAVTIQLWSLIDGVWTQLCGAKTAGRKLAGTVTSIGCPMRGGTQVKAFDTTLLFEVE